MDFTREVFQRTPIKLITYILNKSTEEEKRRANIASISTAKLAHIIIQAVSGLSGNKKPPQVDIGQFLPFEVDSETHAFNEQTKLILRKLIKEGVIPSQVIAALQPLIIVSN